MNFRLFLIVIAALLVGAGGSYLWQQGTAARAAVPADVDAAAATRIVAPTARVVVPSERVLANGPPAPPSSPSSIAARMASADRVADVGEQKLRARYGSERVDGAWAGAKEQALRRLVDDPLITNLQAQPSSFVPDCRASTCRIDATFATLTQANDFFTMYTMVAAPELQTQSMRTTVLPGGKVRAEIYASAKR